jgi:hypothetical protein
MPNQPSPEQAEAVMEMISRMLGAPPKPTAAQEETEKVKIEDAGKMLEAWESEGGRKIQEHLKGLRKIYTIDPRRFIRQSSDGSVIIDQFLVASVASACTILDDIFTHMDVCGKVVERAAQEKSGS